MASSAAATLLLAAALFVGPLCTFSYYQPEVPDVLKDK